MPDKIKILEEGGGEEKSEQVSPTTSSSGAKYVSNSPDVEELAERLKNDIENSKKDMKMNCTSFLKFNSSYILKIFSEFMS